MIEAWNEILDSLKRNKLRSFLTGFAIAWGIFMLIILLAAGQGLRHGVENQFGSGNLNTITVYPGGSSRPHHGFKRGRRIHIYPRDAEFLKQHIPNMTNFCPVFSSWGSTVSYKTKNTNMQVIGTTPSYIHINQMAIIDGRPLNPIDERERRKVCLLDESMQEKLFDGEDPMGKYVNSNDILYKVVGIYSSETSGMNMGQTAMVVPYRTAEAVFSASQPLNILMWETVGIKTKAESMANEAAIRKVFGAYLDFDPKDESAIYVNDRLQDYQDVQMIFTAISMFVWLIGLGTLIAGVVGVGNIMIITVKERTHEFGIRKALGATPNQILRSVLLEALSITTLFGFLGMVVGIGVTELVSFALSMQPASTSKGPGMSTMFVDPSVNISIVIAATLVLIIAGVLAGYIPSRRAVKVKPIEAIMAK